MRISELPKYLQRRVESIEWEPPNEQYWVELFDQWQMDNGGFAGGAHCFAEDTKREVLETLRMTERDMNHPPGTTYDGIECQPSC